MNYLEFSLKVVQCLHHLHTEYSRVLLHRVQ